MGDDKPTTPPTPPSDPADKPLTMKDFTAWLKSDEGKAALRSETPATASNPTPTSTDKPTDLEAAFEAFMAKREASSEQARANTDRDRKLDDLRKEFDTLKERYGRRIRSLFEF